MTAKEYLSQVRKIDRRINITLRKVEKLRSVLEYRSPSWESSGGTNSSADRMADTIARIVEYERRADELIDLYTQKYLEIENAIRAVSEPQEREVLERRYLLYQRWESRYNERTGELEKGIAEEMGYSTQNVYKLHGKALKNISVPEKSRVNYSEIE